MIKGLLSLLQAIEDWEEIQGIIPGRISPSKNAELQLTVQYQMVNGVKCLAKGEGVQEVFIISNEPLLLIERLKSI